MAAHSSILAWRIPWAEEPSRLQTIESQRVRVRRDSHRQTLGTFALQSCLDHPFFLPNPSISRNRTGHNQNLTDARKSPFPPEILLRLSQGLKHSFSHNGPSFFWFRHC